MVYRRPILSFHTASAGSDPSRDEESHLDGWLLLLCSASDGNQHVPAIVGRPEPRQLLSEADIARLGAAGEFAQNRTFSDWATEPIIKGVHAWVGLLVLSP